MATLTARQIAHLVCSPARWGPVEDVATVAVAVALSESFPPGNTESVGPAVWEPMPQGGGDVEHHALGLWQILEPYHSAVCPVVNALDPALASDFAYALWVGRGDDFTDWESYTNDRYLAYVAEARTAVQAELADPSNPDEVVSPDGFDLPLLAEQANRRTTIDITTLTFLTGATLFGVVIGVTRDLYSAVLSADLELTADLVSQLTVTFADPGDLILASGLVDLHASATFGDLTWIVAAVEPGPGAGGETLTVELRAQGPERMKADKGFLSVENISRTEFVRQLGQRAGMATVGQPSATLPLVARNAHQAADTLDPAESSWDCAQRLAAEQGYICFEAANVLYFASPPWLADRTGHVALTWAGERGDGRLMTKPRCRRTLDDWRASKGVTVDLTVARQVAEYLRPGMTVDLAGVATFDGRYLVSKVSGPINGAGGFTVTAATALPIAPHVTTDDRELVPGDYPGGPPVVAPNTTGGAAFIWPTTGDANVSGGQFGAPRTGHIHQGLDIANDEGTRIWASKAGVVSFAGWDEGGGNSVYLDHGDGTVTWYMHFSRFAAGLNDGRQPSGSGPAGQLPYVTQGQLLGYMGSTGHVTGPHLHFEVHVAGHEDADHPYGQVDPLSVLPPIIDSGGAH